MTIFQYTVNYADIAVCVILIGAGVIGYFRGVFINIVKFIRTAIGLFLCFYCSTHLTLPVYEAYVRPRLLASIQEKIVTTANIDEIMQNLNDYAATFPAFVSKNLPLTDLHLSSTDMARSILTNVFEPIVLTMIKIAIFIVTFIVFFGATAVIIHMLRRMNKKKEEKRGKRSVLKKMDMLLGAVFNVCKAAVIIFAVTGVFMYIIAIKEETGLNAFLEEVRSSAVLQFVNSINPFNAITEGLI